MLSDSGLYDIVTIVPTVTLWGLFNSLPEFKTETAMLNRIVNFPFNGVFKVNVKFEDDMLTLLDDLFSYIMINGEIINEIIPSTAMLEKKQEYIADQSNPLLDYISANIDKGVVLKSTRNDWCIKRDEFLQSYYSWCSLNRKRNYEMSKSAFTKAMTKLGINNKESHHIVWLENIQYRPYNIGIRETENGDFEEETVEEI